MALLIDSSVFITIERRGLPATTISAIVPDESSAIATITASELYIGIHRADTPERRASRSAFLTAILGFVQVAAFDLEAAREHARLRVELAAAGTPIGPNDLIIAATALAHGHTIMTDNLREFLRVPGLSVVQPTWPS
jgi:predicted nucleic acid-binding protein